MLSKRELKLLDYAARLSLGRVDLCSRLVISLTPCPVCGCRFWEASLLSSTGHAYGLLHVRHDLNARTFSVGDADILYTGWFAKAHVISADQYTLVNECFGCGAVLSI